MTPFGAVLRGMVAGAVGTVAMDGVRYARQPQPEQAPGFVAWEKGEQVSGWEDAPAFAQVGKRTAEGLLQRELPDSDARLMRNAVHWGTGVPYGAAYGILAGSLRKPRPIYGVLLGLAVWALPHVALAPTGLYEPISDLDRQELQTDLGAHLAYGLATALVFRLLAGGR
jgi:hypothetical protein